MFWLTEDATLVCLHEMGRVHVAPTQMLVTIAGRRVFVERDPEQRSITGCAQLPPMTPCTMTLQVQVGYSDLLRIEQRRVCLDTVSGLTNGSPPGVVLYKVRRPGQDLVAEGT